ncbi:tryptophan 7-halogenase [Sphingomonas sp. SM33]|uniref:Tryptophan 7-halogenase n=1 Tax=Sphingomonas telluris TaxID=2907998 RepID=A0ABS9VJV8_9SPHN|nr:tryptophan halogenase family protein [Sphingomonas telluris]MCH8615270.1 tryptophan 7-halogenase [Sphingomonas telluris]
MRKILIVGGGSAGWMTAALMGKLFQGLYDVELVESEAIGTVGVGEATIPAIKKYNELLALDEAEFMQRTQATFKLGIEFVDWLKQGHTYIHAFGVIGQDWEWLRCHHYWLRANERGRARDFSAYSINCAAALKNKFMRARPDMADSPIGHIAHAFHFDASLYAKYLRSFAEQHGVKRTEGKILDVEMHDNGDIAAVRLEDDRRIEADFFIDCSGFRALLIEQTLKTGYEDWSHWLPCDRAMAVPCTRTDPLIPLTRSTARESGWQWRIGLQHRTGNGLVYSSRHIDDDSAEKLLLSNLDGEQLADPNKLRFTAGKRRKMWNRNCVAIGLAAGFLEPLESTSLHLVQSAAIRLVRLFPDRATDQATIEEFNRQSDFEWERIRDFIVLHYCATERDDSDFWRYCRTMELPDTLQRKIDLWKSNGRVFREDEELFSEESWIQVFIGQGVIPRSCDPLVAIKSDAQIEQFLGNIAATIDRCVDVMPSHSDFVQKFCPAEPVS